MSETTKDYECAMHGPSKGVCCTQAFRAPTEPCKRCGFSTRPCDCATPPTPDLDAVREALKAVVGQAHSPEYRALLDALGIRGIAAPEFVADALLAAVSRPAEARGEPSEAVMADAMMAFQGWDVDEEIPETSRRKLRENFIGDGIGKRDSTYVALRRAVRAALAAQREQTQPSQETVRDALVTALRATQFPQIEQLASACGIDFRQPDSEPAIADALLGIPRPVAEHAQPARLPGDHTG